MTFDANEFDPKTFFVESSEPKHWLKMAIVLQHAASNLDWTKQRDFTDWRYKPIYRMLMAFSIENLLKGILIVEGHEAIEGEKLSKRLSNHGLRQYAEDVSGVTITEPEKCLLDELQHYLIWAGRYPMPTKPAYAIQTGHSNAEHDAELALGQKLADYLVQRTNGRGFGEGTLFRLPARNDGRAEPSDLGGR
jgi:hypothetical protein